MGRVEFFLMYGGIEPSKRAGQVVDKREEWNFCYTQVKYSASVCNR